MGEVFNEGLRDVVDVWVTADARRIPVRVRSKVPVGSVSGDLESYTPPGGS